MSGSFKSLSLRLTHHVSLLRVPNLHPQGACLLLFFSKVSRFLWARGVLEAVSRQTGLWDFRTRLGEGSLLGPLPSGLNLAGWAVPSRISALSKINLLTEGCHGLTDFFFLIRSMSLIHFPTGAVERQFIYCPLNQTQMGWYTKSNRDEWWVVVKKLCFWDGFDRAANHRL